MSDIEFHELSAMSTTGHFLKVTFVSETNQALYAILLVVHYKINTAAQKFFKNSSNFINSDMGKSMVHVFSWKGRDFSEKH